MNGWSPSTLSECMGRMTCGTVAMIIMVAMVPLFKTPLLLFYPPPSKHWLFQNNFLWQHLNKRSIQVCLWGEKKALSPHSTLWLNRKETIIFLVIIGWMTKAGRVVTAPIVVLLWIPVRIWVLGGPSRTVSAALRCFAALFSVQIRPWRFPSTLSGPDSCSTAPRRCLPSTSALSFSNVGQATRCRALGADGGCR